MRQMGTAALAALLLLAGLVSADPSEGKITVRPVGYDGLVKAVRDLEGKVVLVDFWAEYCTPCKEELKALLALQQKYGRDGLVLLTVSLDDSDDKEAKERIGAFLAQEKANCTNFILDAPWRQWQSKLGVAGPPCLYVFGRDGYFVHKHTLETEPRVIEDEVARLLEPRAPAGSLTAPDAPIDFRVTLHPPDPFSEQNQPGRPQAFRRGEVFRVVVEGTPKPGYHTYPMTQRTAGQSAGTLSRWQPVPAAGLRPLWPIVESKPTFRRERTRDVLLELPGPFTWSRDVVVLPDARPGAAALSFTLQLTACDEKSCTPGKYPFKVPLTITDGKPLPLSDDLWPRLEEGEPGAVVLAAPAALEPDETPALPQPAEGGLLGLILTTMGAALAMLCTPCVFPMVPITVSFFLKQSEKERRSAWLTALVYSTTIVVVLALAVLILGKIIVDLASSPWMNLGLGLLLVVFAFSLFGMYELELPHFLSQFTAAREGKGGYLGAVFMALTFTITSFTCTGPFLGPLLVATREMQLGTGRLVLAAFVYAATFAGPFFVLALFPALLKRLPRSGGWLNAVKVVMGFLELAAAFKFLTNTDAALHPGSPWLFTYDAVLCAWIALAVACGLYLLGVYRLPHDTPAEHIGVPRLLLATFFLGLGLYLIPLLWGRTPQGVIGQALAGFAPLNTAELPGQAHAAGPDRLDWYLDYEKAREKALAENKLLFLDFTGVSCQNCRANEAGVFSQPDVRVQLKNYVRVQLYTDSVPKVGLTAAQARSEAEHNSRRESETFRQISTPLYVIFQPSRDRAEESGKLLGVERGRAAGYIQDVSAFVDLLKKARGREVAQCE